MKSFAIFFLVGVLSVVMTAQGVDRIVDATGAQSVYTNITQAMLASAPGDRIFVLPGSYPAFQFSRGVHVIGLGATPAAVVVDNIAFHPSIPNINFDALISNMTIQSADPLDVESIHGNEIPPGVLVIDGVRMKGGVFLRGGQAGFYCLISNSNIEPLPGYGFSGEACFIGGPGNFFEIRNTRIAGWNADASQGLPAGLGIRIGGGTQVRITHSDVSGGSGVGAVLPFSAGADAIISSLLGPVALRIDGGSTVTGGGGAPGFAGGDGVDVVGTVESDNALVVGGSGAPAGAAWSNAQPVAMPVDMEMTVSPSFEAAAGPVAATSGEVLSFSLNSGALPTVIGISLAVQLPNGPFVPLAANDAIIVVGNTWSVTIPPFPGGIEFVGLQIFAQGAVLDGSGNFVLSNTASIRVNLQ